MDRTGWLLDVTALIARDDTLSIVGAEALIDQAGEAIATYCDRQLLAPAELVTQSYVGDGSQRLILREWPVVVLDELSIGGVLVPERSVVADHGYTLRSHEGWLGLHGYTLEKGADVLVRCRCGYDAALAQIDRKHRKALDELAQACVLQCQAWLANPDAGLTCDVRDLLQTYRRLGI